MKSTMKFDTILLTFVLILLETGTGDAKKEMLDFGDDCDPHAAWKHLPVCNPELNLECSGKNCRCNSRSLYNKVRGMCLMEVGSPCTPTAKLDLCPANATCQSGHQVHNRQGKMTKIFTKYYNLVKSHLGMDKFSCACLPGFEASASKFKCRPFLAHGATCVKDPKAKDLRCDAGGFQDCGANGTCTCKHPQTMKYDKESKRCEISLGAACTFQGTANPCAKHAICTSLLNFIRKSSDTSNSNNQYGNSYSHMMWAAQMDLPKQQGICTCQPGFSENAEGKCIGSYHVACTKPTDCNAVRFLSCIDGICQCEKSTAQIFSASSVTGGTCNIKVGYPCDEKSGSKCVQNSVCVKNQCACATGFSETSDGRCLLAQGAKCSMPEGQAGNVTACNHFQGLACTTASKCDCFDPLLKWNAQKQICGAAEGKSCGKISTMIVNKELAKDILYPFGFTNSSVISYVVGCDTGFICDTDKVLDNLQRCRKV